MSKSSHFYKNKDWDLVDAVESEDFEYESIDQLPKELIDKSESEINKYVEAKRKEREQIQEEIAALNKKRLDYIATRNKDQKNELRNAMIQAIKNQASRKLYHW